MPSIKRASLQKAFPDQESIVAMEQLFRGVDRITTPKDMPPPATDLTTAITLLNAIRARLVSE